ncbi:MAG: GNAT family N-acetyltransferase, partial [Pseudomonadota bacterium]
MSPRTIRPARPDDLAAVSALLADSYPTLLAPDYPADVLARVLPFIAKAKPNLLASGTYHVAHDASGQLLAGGGWTAVAPGAEATVPGVGHIRHVVANPKTLRQGHARAVLEVSLRQAKTAGIRRMCCLSTLTAR